MKKVRAILGNPTIISLIGIVLLALIIWLVGPIIAIGEMVPLASSHVRMLAIAIIFLAWGLNNLRVKHADKKAADSLNAELMKTDDQAAKQSSPAGTTDLTESDIINDRLQQALKRLQAHQKGFGRQKLYQLPWYVLVGAPGSGKTTALQQSGLNFPLDNALESGAVPGSGGTRYCDWWFSDEAILIDTAGRYTTQDTPSKTESRAWLSFLARLRKARPKRPLNGIIVTISIDELIGKTATQRRLHATALKHRIQELNNHLAMALPVYVLITKADRIGGFSAFFQTLDDTERAAPWGITFKAGLLQSGNTPADNHTRLRQFDDAFEHMVAQVNKRTLPRLQEEHNGQYRELIFQFPQQVQALKDRLDEFLAILFTPNQFEEPIHWRGIYLVSATQATQSSQWIGSIFPGDALRPPTEPRAAEPRKYFLKQLFTDVIFSEAAMAQLNRSARNRLKWITLASFTGVSACFIAAIAGWHYSSYANHQTIAQIEAEIEQYETETFGGLSTSSDWVTLAKGLTRLSNLPKGYTPGSEQASVFNGLGLYQGEKLGAQARDTYLQSLAAFFQVKLTDMLLLEIDAAGQDDEYLYESLKHYLMLYHPQEMDTDSFKTWVQLLWRKVLPSDKRQAVTAALMQHLEVVLSHNLTPPPIDTLRVARSRHLLKETPLDLRIYRRIKEAWQREQEHFSVVSVLGPRAQYYFERSSAERLDLGVPALFTYRGFHTGYMIERRSLAKQLSAEQWIYGKGSTNNAIDETTLTEAGEHTNTPESLTLSNEALSDLATAVDAHYFKDYILHWERFLNDIRLRDFSDIDGGWQLVRALSGADQPVQTLLLAIRENLALDALPKTSSDGLEKLAEATGSNRLDQAARLERLVPDQLSDSVSLPGATVSNHFSDWIAYTDPDTQNNLAQLDQLFSQFNDTFSAVTAAENIYQASFELMAGTGFRHDRQLRRMMASAPPSLQAWFNTLGQASRRVFAVGARLHVNERWKSHILPTFDARIAGRYPIASDSTQDVARKDFSEFFGPDGTLHEFFKTYVQPFVRQRGNTLAWRSSIGLRNRSLSLFEKMFAIQKAYFSSEDGLLRLDFYLTPDKLSKAATGVTLNFGDDKYRYFHGPPRTAKLYWPQEPSTETTLTFALSSRGTPITVVKRGEWSWFRLLDTAQLTPAGDNVRVVFKVGEVESSHLLRPVSGHNPFGERLVDTFTLPQTL